MRTTSQSGKETLKHAAQEPGRNRDQATRLGTASPGVATARETRGANETFKRARTLIKPLLGCLFLGVFSALTVSLVSHFAVVAPLEKNLLSAEVRRLATEIDSEVRMRSSLITMVAGNAELDSFLESGGLDKMLTALRNNFPDFLSVEATNDRGQIQAMGGDLPLSQAGLFSKGPSEKSSTVNLGIQHNRGSFHDDPENNCFFITCKHVGPEGGKWFTRSRFSREAVVGILNSIPARRVTLVPITGASKDIHEGPVSVSRQELAVVRTIGNWWRGPIGAEALLAMPGWLIRMENSAAPPILWRPPVAVPLFLLLLTLMAGIILRQAHLRGSWDRNVDQENAGGQSSVQHENPATESVSSKRSDCSSGDSGEKSPPLEQNHALLKQQPESKKPAPPAVSGSADCDDLLCLPELLTTPDDNPRVVVTNNLRDEPRAPDSRESEPFPETLEVSWFEPCGLSGVREPQSDEKHESAPPSREEEGHDSERCSQGGHLLSA